VGNLKQESDLDPNADQPDGLGRGIAQWSEGGRWDTDDEDNLIWFANKHDLNPLKLNPQLSFIWYELTHFSYYGLDSLKAAKTLEQAVVAFQDNFENCDPAACDTPSRIMFAERALRRYAVPQRRNDCK